VSIKADFELNDNGVSGKTHGQQTFDQIRIPDLGTAASTLAPMPGPFGRRGRYGERQR
jgi:hypothetical protein